MTHRSFASLSFLILLVTGCEKPNPQPELGDETVQATGNLKQEVAKKIEEEKGKLESIQQEVAEANPQSGLLRASRLHYFESLNKLENLKQLEKYYDVRQKLRTADVQREYLSHFYAHDGREIASDDFTEDEANRGFKRSWRVGDRIAKAFPNRASEKKSEKKESSEGEKPVEKAE